MRWDPWVPPHLPPFCVLEVLKVINLSRGPHLLLFRCYLQDNHFQLVARCRFWLSFENKTTTDGCIFVSVLVRLVFLLSLLFSWTTQHSSPIVERWVKDDPKSSPVLKRWVEDDSTFNSNCRGRWVEDHPTFISNCRGRWVVHTGSWTLGRGRLSVHLQLSNIGLRATKGLSPIADYWVVNDPTFALKLLKSGLFFSFLLLHLFWVGRCCGGFVFWFLLAKPENAATRHLLGPPNGHQINSRSRMATTWFPCNGHFSSISPRQAHGSYRRVLGWFSQFHDDWWLRTVVR